MTFVEIGDNVWIPWVFLHIRKWGASPFTNKFQPLWDSFINLVNSGSKKTPFPNDNADYGNLGLLLLSLSLLPLSLFLCRFLCRFAAFSVVLPLFLVALPLSLSLLTQIPINSIEKVIYVEIGDKEWIPRVFLHIRKWGASPFTNTFQPLWDSFINLVNSGSKKTPPPHWGGALKKTLFKYQPPLPPLGGGVKKTPFPNDNADYGNLGLVQLSTCGKDPARRS